MIFLDIDGYHWVPDANQYFMGWLTAVLFLAHGGAGLSPLMWFA
jgi:hypothetical protein